LEYFENDFTAKANALADPNTDDLVQREHPPPKLGWNRDGSGAHKSCQISEKVQDSTKVTVTD